MCDLIESANWAQIIPWASLIAGALLGTFITIFINYISIKQQEIIKLKAKIAEDKIRIVRAYLSYELFLGLTMITKITKEDLLFGYELSEQDLSAPTLRMLHILSDYKSYSDFKVKITGYFEEMDGLGCNDIRNYTQYIRVYLLNLDILLEDIPESYYPQISIALKNDFMNFKNELSALINRYLNRKLYQFRVDRAKEVLSDKEIRVILEKTNFWKYRKELSSFKESST